MKNNILKFFFTLIVIFIVLVVFLSTAGIETDRFNTQIKSRIAEINKNLTLDLKKIKITLDPVNFKIYAKTVGATVFFSKKPLPLEYIKAQISLNSLIKNKIVSSNIQIATRSIMLNDFIKFIRAIYNKPELLILEKTVKKGHILLDLNLNIDNNGKIKKDYEIKGLIKNVNINFFNKGKFENINFNFNLKQDNYLLNEINLKVEKVNFTSKKLNIFKKENSFLIDGTVKNNPSNLNINILKLLKLNFKNISIEQVKFDTNNKFSLEIDSKYNVKNIVLNSDINIDQLKYKKPDIIQNYLPEQGNFILLKDHKLNLNYKDNNLSVKGEGEYELTNNQADKIKYQISKKDKNFNINTELFLKNINLQSNDFLKIFFPQINQKINFNNHKLKINYNNENLLFIGSGKFKIYEDFEEIEYFFKKKNTKINFSTKLNLKNTNFKIDNLNYKKKNDNNMLLQIEGELNDSKYLNINSLNIDEGKNNIHITNLSLNNLNQIKKIDQANFDYVDNDNKKNNYTIKKLSNYNYSVNGTSFNANSLISNLLERSDKENSFFENDLIIDLNLKKVYIDKIYLVNDLKGNFSIKNNKIVDGDILAFLDYPQNIKFTIRTNEHGEQITTLFSSKARPLVNRYKFIKGFKDGKDGYLDFYSLNRDGVSSSKLVIDNFKVKEIPALAKLLALSSLQGIADLLTGEGIRFTDFEMNFTNESKQMRIQELYAIGPAISILLEGYIQEDSLISLRGTLVPATTINRSIASIPLLGDLLIGKKVGEGVFGVSFKIKGTPKNLETTVNPIKTLTPRFITRTLEKIKKH